MAVPLIALSHHLALGQFQGGKQRGGAVAFVVVGQGGRSAPSASASRVGCDPELEFGSFRPHTAPSPAPVDSDIDPPRP